MDFINNRGKKIVSLTTAVSNDKIVTINRVHNVTTITTIDRNRVRRPRRRFTGDSLSGNQVEFAASDFMGWRPIENAGDFTFQSYLCALPPSLKRAYHWFMRHFNTKQVVGGGTRFNCVHCPFSVNTLDFAILNGNLRTQAAAAINQHSASEHVSNLLSSKPIVRVTRS
jgi:hypothetical protein